MKVNVKISNNVIIEAEGKTQAEIFEQIASMSETFSTLDENCGKCGGNKKKVVARTDDEDNNYYELVCLNCWAKLAFGQNKKPEGQLYPRRIENKKKSAMKGELEPGQKLPNNGWLKWNKEKEKYE